MRLLLVSSSLLLLLACESAGGGADVLDSVGGASGAAGSGVGGSTGTTGGAAGEDGGELPPPEEENPGGAGGSGTGGAGSDAGAGGSAGEASGGTGGTGGKGGSGGGFDPNAPCDVEDGWPAASRALECEVLAMVNERRAAGATCGGLKFDPVPALKMHPILRKVAREHAKDMADNDYFDHTSPDGSSSGDRMKAAGYEGTYYGENIAHGQKDAAAVMKSWMNSSGHCKGIMRGDYHHLGVGFAATPGGDTYWVQDFAAP